MPQSDIQTIHQRLKQKLSWLINYDKPLKQWALMVFLTRSLETQLKIYGLNQQSLENFESQISSIIIPSNLDSLCSRNEKRSLTLFFLTQKMHEKLQGFVPQSQHPSFDPSNISVYAPNRPVSGKIHNRSTDPYGYYGDDPYGINPCTNIVNSDDFHKCPNCQELTVKRTRKILKRNFPHTFVL